MNRDKKKKSSSLKVKTAHFWVLPKKIHKHLISIYFEEGDNYEERKLGKIFGVFQVEDESDSSQYISNFLVSVIKNEYYSSPGRSSGASFEASLRKANLALSEMARSGNIFWRGRINYAGGAIQNNNFHFSCLGNASAYIIREGKIAPIWDTKFERNNQVHPLKTFSIIKSGEVRLGDYIIFSTWALEKYFSLEEIKQHIENLGIDDFCEYIKLSFEKINIFSAAIIAQILPATEEKPLTWFIAEGDIEPTPIFKKESPREIIYAKHPTLKNKEAELGNSELISSDSDYLEKKVTEQPTLKIEGKVDDIKVSHGIAAKFSAIYDRLRTFKSSFRKTEKSSKAVKLTERELAAVRGEGYYDSEAGINQFEPKKHLIKKILTCIASIKKHWLIFSNFILRKTKNFWLAIKDLIVMRRRKYLITVVLSTIFVLSLGGVHLYQKQRKVINAPLMPSQNISQEQSLSEIAKAEKNGQMIEEVASWEIEGEILGIHKYDEHSIIAVTKNEVHVIEETGEKKSYIIPTDFQIPLWSSFMKDINTLFIGSEEGKIIAFYPPSKKFVPNFIPLTKKNNKLKVKAFLTYLYIMDSEDLIIWRFPRIENGFGSPQNWLKESEPPAETIDMAVNDSIYLATPEKISRYYRGKFQPEPEFENPTNAMSISMIYSSSGDSYIWALDKQNRRIISWDKEGKITGQYFMEKLTEAKQFFVNESAKNIYFSSDNKITKLKTP